MVGWTIYLSFGAALMLMLLPERREQWARVLALGAAAAGLVFSAFALFQSAPGAFRTVTRLSWIPTLGIDYHLGADGISLVLVFLTGLAAVAGILFSWNINHRPREFFALYLALIGGVYGVFLSFDLFLLFVFYEIAIIPKYFLIAIWGSTRREYAAMKLALYSFVGSAMVLVGLVAAFVLAGGQTMSLADLAAHRFPREFQMWAFPLVFVGFAVLAGLWPFHTWAPTGHVAAPTAASMLLAGVVMKLGAYGCLRVAMTLFPEGLQPWGFELLGIGSWRDVFAWLAVMGILYGGLVALVQKDFKFVIGYSSVSHMGFVLLGLMTLQTIGLTGAVLQMFSHGIVAGLLFAVVGRMVYDRAHTRQLDDLQPMNLSRALPFAAVTFTLATLASIGLPGFSGFIAELQVLIGAWHAYPTLAVLTGAGILVGVAYGLRALQRAFFAELRDYADGGAPGSPRGGSVRPSDSPAPLEPISLAERVGAVLLVAASLAVGLYPDLLLKYIIPSFNAPWFDRLRAGGLP